MTKAPIASTIIAIGLIPVAFLFLHAFISGIKKWRYHKFTGMAAIIWDLSMSIGYMLYRTFGGKAGGSSLDLHGAILAYFIVHGVIALIVILLEISVLTTGIWRWRQNKDIKLLIRNPGEQSRRSGIGLLIKGNCSIAGLHMKLAKILFILWWFAFLSGELFYFVKYILSG